MGPLRDALPRQRAATVQNLELDPRVRGIGIWFDFQIQDDIASQAWRCRAVDEQPRLVARPPVKPERAVTFSHVPAVPNRNDGRIDDVLLQRDDLPAPVDGMRA